MLSTKIAEDKVLREILMPLVKSVRYKENNDNSIKIPYNLKGRNESGLVGSAYKNLINFKIIRDEKLDKIHSYSFENAFKGAMTLGRRFKTYDIMTKYQSDLNEIVNFDEVLMSDKAINIAIRFAKLELMQKQGYFEEDKDYYIRDIPKDHQIIKELKNLYKGSKDLLNDVKRVDSKTGEIKDIYINPEFSNGRFLSNAECDLILDDTMYEYKTTSKEGITSRETAKILTLYMVNRLASNEYGEIKKLIIFKARENNFYEIDIDSLDETLLNDTLLKIKDHLGIKVNPYILEEITKKSSLLDSDNLPER